MGVHSSFAQENRPSHRASRHVRIIRQRIVKPSGTELKMNIQLLINSLVEVQACPVTASNVLLGTCYGVRGAEDSIAAQTKVPTEPESGNAFRDSLDLP